MLLQQNYMFRKTNLPLWLLIALMPILCFGADKTDNVQPSEPLGNQVEIEGNVIETMLDRKMKAKGDAVIKKGIKVIKSDVIEYDEISEKITTTGSTDINLGNMSLKGSKLDYKLSDETGRMEDATFIFKPDKKTKSKTRNGIEITNRVYSYRGDAKTIFFEGENKKRMTSSHITTCEADSDDWYLKSNSMEVNTKTDRVQAYSTSVEFKGVPILYTPYINFSLNNNRKSGFLSSTFGSTSKSGFDLQIPYYFNISPNMDATLTARYLGKRGPLADGEYRYMGENFSGIDKIQLLSHDEASGKDNRYFVNLSHSHKLDNGLSAYYNFQKVSDNDYFGDLSSSIQTTSTINLPQRAGIGYTNDGWKMNLLAEKFQTLTTASNSPYQRLPQINLIKSAKSNNFQSDFKSEWVYFDRDSKFIFDNNNKVTGSRLSITETIGAPIRRSYGYIEPKIGVNMRSYSLNNTTGSNYSSNKNLIIPTVSINSGVYFDREVNIFNENYNNSIEPQLSYIYTPYVDQSMVPLFDTGVSSVNMGTLFNGNIFNGVDRISDTNQISAGLTSRLINKNGIQSITGSIAQSYYFSDQKVYQSISNKSRNYSNIFASINTRISRSLNLAGSWEYDPDYNKILRNTITAKYNPDIGKFVNFSYRMSNDDLLKEINLAGQWPLGNRFYSIGRFNYDLLRSETIEIVGGIEYDGGCWVARTVFDRISLPTSPVANYTFFVQLELNGLGNIGTDANSLNKFLYRNVPGVRTVNELPDANRQANFN